MITNRILTIQPIYCISVKVSSNLSFRFLQFLYLPHTKTAWSANSAAAGAMTTGNATTVTTAETGPTETVTASITAAIAANVWRTVVCVRNVNSAWSAVFARIDAVGVKNMAKPSARTVVKNALAAVGSAANVRNALTA